jgi:cysteine desulfurase
MLANNETGILFPVAEIAEVVKQNSSALFHVDGVNAAGKVPISLRDTQIDLFSISGHKFHGPKGVGALYIRNGVILEPFLFGGGQERSRRAGTEGVHQIVGIGAAAKFVADMSAMERVGRMRDCLEQSLLFGIPDACVNGTTDTDQRLPNTSSISFKNTNGEAILARLNDHGICVSTGSACNSESHTASPVLEAMNIPYSTAMGAIRFSLGRFNTEDEVDTVLSKLPGIIADLRAMA